uniref:Uncharacterized protein n=1 Tax=Solanum lycopersicum TaxID=4081 RepID=A0A3Q7IXI7_SOLLC
MNNASSRVTELGYQNLVTGVPPNFITRFKKFSFGSLWCCSFFVFGGEIFFCWFPSPIRYLEGGKSFSSVLFGFRRLF